MNLQIDNRQNFVKLDRAGLRQLVHLLATRALRGERGTAWSGITVVLTNDRGIQTFKQAAFGYREITDVVTLRYAPSPADPGIEGEIFINVQRAAAAPCRANWSPAHDLALYIAHGLDHLSGADDATPATRRRMRQRELRWLRTPPCRELIARL